MLKTLLVLSVFLLLIGMVRLYLGLLGVDGKGPSEVWPTVSMVYLLVLPLVALIPASLLNIFRNKTRSYTANLPYVFLKTYIVVMLLFKAVFLWVQYTDKLG